MTMKIKKKFSLIETLAWKAQNALEDSGEFGLLTYHIARMSRSAKYFNIPFDQKELEEKLYRVGQNLTKQGRKQRKIRIILESDGKLYIHSQKLTAPPELPVKIDISQYRVKSSDIFLYHKTSKRRLFEHERKRLGKMGLFETIFLNEQGELTQGTITNLFIDNGRGILKTPALNCGLLPGTLRQYLLDCQAAREAILTPSDLASAKRILVGNSLRGLLRAKLV